MTDEKRTRLMDMISGMSDDEVQVLLQKLENHEPLGDKRRSSRFPYTISVDFSTPTSKGIARLRDISIGGLFLEVDPSQRPFSVGNELVLRVPYPNKEKHVKIRGRIVRATLEGIGVEFDKSRDQHAP